MLIYITPLATSAIYPLSLHDALPILITSTEGRCVARIKWMPTARAICASRVMDSSTLLVSTIIRSASSSITMIRRSEEHTSELQSHSDLVCSLLLEKQRVTEQAQPYT